MNFIFFSIIVSEIFLKVLGNPNVSSSTCVNVPSKSLCLQPLNYNRYSLSNNSTCGFESGLLPVWSALSDSCLSAVAEFQCALGYPFCGFTSDQLCPSSCFNVMKACGPGSPGSGSSASWALLTNIFPLLANECQSEFYKKAKSNDLCFLPSGTIQSFYNDSLITTPNNANNNNNPVNIMKPSCVPYTGNACSGIIDYPVYITNTPMALIESYAIQFQFLYTLMSNNTDPLANNNLSCPVAFSKFLCLQFFPKCQITNIAFNSQGIITNSDANSNHNNNNNNNSSNVISIISSSPMCTSVCNDFTSSCSSFVSSLSPLLASSSNPGAILLASFLKPNCTNYHDGLSSNTCGFISQYINSITKLPDDALQIPLSVVLNNNNMITPNTYNNYMVGSNVIVMNKSISVINECSSFQGRSISWSSIYVTCPSPMVYSLNSDTSIIPNGFCSFPCPNPYLSQAEWDSVDKFALIFSCISLIASTFMLFTWLIFPSKRIQNSVVNFIVCCFCVSAIIFFSFVDTPAIKDRVCSSNGMDTLSPHVFGSENNFDLARAQACVASGAMTVYFMLAMFIWWGLISLDLYIHLIAFSRSTAQKQFQKLVFNIYGWGLPSIFVSIGLATDSFGGNSVFPICLFSDKANKWSEWLLFYFPLIAHFFGALVLISLVIFALMKSTHARQRRKPRTTNNNNQDNNNANGTNNNNHSLRGSSGDGKQRALTHPLNQNNSVNNNSANNRGATGTVAAPTPMNDPPMTQRQNTIIPNSPVNVPNNAKTDCCNRIFSWTPAFWETVKPHSRILIFVFGFTLLFSSLLIVRVHAHFATNDVTISLANWVLCLLVSGSANSFKCGDKPVDVVYVNELFLFVFGITGQGLIQFLAFGTNQQNYLLWINLCKGGGVSLRNVKNDTKMNVNGIRNNRDHSSQDSARKNKNNKAKLSKNGNNSGNNNHPTTLNNSDGISMLPPGQNNLNQQRGPLLNHESTALGTQAATPLTRDRSLSYGKHLQSDNNIQMGETHNQNNNAEYMVVNSNNNNPASNDLSINENVNVHQGDNSPALSPYETPNHSPLLSNRNLLQNQNPTSSSPSSPGSPSPQLFQSRPGSNNNSPVLHTTKLQQSYVTLSPNPIVRSRTLPAPLHPGLPSIVSKTNSVIGNGSSQSNVNANSNIRPSLIQLGDVRKFHNQKTGLANSALELYSPTDNEQFSIQEEPEEQPSQILDQSANHQNLATVGNNNEIYNKNNNNNDNIGATLPPMSDNSPQALLNEVQNETLSNSFSSDDAHKRPSNIMINPNPLARPSISITSTASVTSKSILNDGYTSANDDASQRNSLIQIIDNNGNYSNQLKLSIITTPTLSPSQVMDTPLKNSHSSNCTEHVIQVTNEETNVPSSSSPVDLSPSLGHKEPEKGVIDHIPVPVAIIKQTQNNFHSVRRVPRKRQTSLNERSTSNPSKSNNDTAYNSFKSNNGPVSPKGKPSSNHLNHASSTTNHNDNNHSNNNNSNNNNNGSSHLFSFPLANLFSKFTHSSNSDKSHSNPNKNNNNGSNGLNGQDPGQQGQSQASKAKSNNINPDNLEIIVFESEVNANHNKNNSNSSNPNNQNNLKKKIRRNFI